nr:MAG: nonstructural protein [Microvirus sp.]
MKGIYTIYDTVADEIGPIMIYNTDQQAQRAFPSAFKNNPDISMKDFKLLHLGYIETNIKTLFDEQTSITAIIPEDKTPYLVAGEIQDFVNRGKMA